jgi:hypothetical protein
MLGGAVEAFRQAMTCGFRNDYTTTTGRKLFPQTEDSVCIICGVPTSQTCNEGVFVCSNEHWKEYKTLPEFVAWGKEARAADDAESLALNEWKAAGQELGKQHKNLTQTEQQLQFAIGDWLSTGEDRGYIGSHYSCNYPEAERITGYRLSSLRNFAYVARHVHPSIRMDAVSFGIHQLLAPLKDVEDQKRILREAAAKPLSVAEVRDLVKGLPSTIVPKTNDEHEVVNGTSPWRIDDALGPEGSIAKKRMSKWWSEVLTPDKKMEEVWQFYLPRMSSSSRVATAEKLRQAAERLEALADKVEFFQSATPNEIGDSK